MRPTARVFAKRAHVFIQGEPADYFYKVISGVICTYRLLNSGRRLIDDFYVAGDIFGLETCDEHRLSAATMSEASMIAIERRRLEMLLASEAALSQEINSSLRRSLERAQDHAVLLRHNTPKERVSAFLLDMAERTSKRDNFKLRHTDIADYLGLSRETVSRVLAQLAPKRNAIREAWPCKSDAGRRRSLVDRQGQGSVRAAETRVGEVVMRTEPDAAPLLVIGAD
jgi:CRP/FNR family nitrogen fixation transcriptional regulator